MRSLICFIALALISAACSSTTEPTGPADSAQVVTVLDGDSLVVRIDGGNRDVRLLGINTPERDECFSDEARAATADMVSPTVQLLGEGGDQFGRLLRYVYAEDGALINLELIQGGFALALSTEHGLLDEFKAAEAGAFADRLGLWQTDACGPAGASTVGISRVEPNAPGDDTQNPNGEWVEIANQGSDSVQLSGWTVRDESSQHRYSFPSGFTLDAGAEVRVLSGCGDNSADELYWCEGARYGTTAATPPTCLTLPATWQPEKPFSYRRCLLVPTFS